MFIQALTWNLVYGRKIARHPSEASENADCRGTQDHQPPYLSSPTRTIGFGSAAEPRRELTRIGYGWMWAKPSIGDTPWWGPVQFIFSRTAEGPWNASRIFFQAHFNMQRPNGHLSLPVLPVALRCKSGSRDRAATGSADSRLRNSSSSASGLAGVQPQNQREGGGWRSRGAQGEEQLSSIFVLWRSSRRYDWHIRESMETPSRQVTQSYKPPINWGLSSSAPYPVVHVCVLCIRREYTT